MYPVTLKHDFFRGDYYEEMTPEEYEAAIDRFLARINELEKKEKTEKLGACDSGYLAYLNAWFGDGVCDGYLSYRDRIDNHKLPMSQTNYWAG